MKILELKNVSVDYKLGYRTISAVKDISLTVNEGDYFCIVGQNGSGKSTLIKAILGLVPVTRGSAQYYIDKEDIAYLPQINMIEKTFPATVREVILTGTQKKGRRIPFYSSRDTKIVDETMALLAIEDLAKRRIGELSGGQQQRAMLARALCRNPKLLILDEPCSGLDEKSAQGFYHLLSKLNETLRVTILMVSHDLDQVLANATNVAVLDTHLHFCGNVKEWQTHIEGSENR